MCLAQGKHHIGIQNIHRKMYVLFCVVIQLYKMVLYLAIEKSNPTHYSQAR
jgi:hypothetical protein